MSKIFGLVDGACSYATACLLATLLVAVPASAQAPLSLSEAIARATAKNPDAGAAQSAERESLMTELTDMAFPSRVRTCVR